MNEFFNSFWFVVAIVFLNIFISSSFWIAIRRADKYFKKPLKDRISKVFDKFVLGQKDSRELEDLKIFKESVCDIVEDSIKAVDGEITDDHVSWHVLFYCIYFLGMQKSLNDAFLNMFSKANELEKKGGKNEKKGRKKKTKKRKR